MADRKISELNEARRVFDKDYLVVVTGVGQYRNPSDPSQGFVDLVTSRMPVSGLAAWSFRVNEMVSGCTGIQIIPHINTGLFPPSMNKISICTTGVSYTGHKHTSADITDFGNAVSGLIEQQIKILDTPVSYTGAPTTLNELSINLKPNTKYLCEVGLILNQTTSSTRISGQISSTGILATNNNLLNIYGTWNTNDLVNQSAYNTSSSISGWSTIADGINTHRTTSINKFTVSTYANESDRIFVRFAANNVDGAVLAGSWLKAEKIV